MVEAHAMTHVEAPQVLGYIYFSMTLYATKNSSIRVVHPYLMALCLSIHTKYIEEQE